MQKLVWGYASKGGRLINLSPSNALSLMESYPNCTVTVYETGTLTLADIYSDNGVTVKSNPFVADSKGYFEFYAPNGRYDVKLSGSSLEIPYTIPDILVFDGGDTAYIENDDPRVSPIGTAGTYDRVTTDQYGRVISGQPLNASHVLTALGFNPSTIDAVCLGRTTITTTVNNTWAPVTFNTIYSDTVGMAPVGTGSRITARHDGFISLKGHLFLEAAAPGMTAAYLRIMKNGIEQIAHVGPRSGTDVRLIIDAHDEASAGDWYQIEVFTSIGAGNVSYNVTPKASPRFSAILHRLPFDGTEVPYWGRFADNPVVIPVGSETAVFEPNVKVVNGTWHMFHTAGSAAGFGIVHQTSPDGLVWTRQAGYVVGLGNGGETGWATRGGLYEENGTFYLTYATGEGGGTLGDSIKLLTATNINGPWTPRGVILSPALPLDFGLANTTMFKDGSTYLLFVDGLPQGGDGVWRCGLATSSSPLGPFTFLPSVITSLSIGGHTSAGSIHRIGNKYYNWYHLAKVGNLPSQVWRAETDDVDGNTWANHTLSWKEGLQEQENYPLVPIFGAGFVPDQVADPFVIEVDGKSYMYVDVDDNTGTYQAGISVSIFHGTLAELVQVVP